MPTDIRVEFCYAIPAEGVQNRRMRAANEDGNLSCRHLFDEVFLLEEGFVGVERSCANAGFYFEI